MRKLLLIVIIVIILVSLNWFNRAEAQDVRSLTPQQREALMQQYGGEWKSLQQRPQTATANPYRSPHIFDTTVPPLVPVDNHQVSQLDENPETTAPISSGLTPFDQLEPFGSELFRGPQEAAPPDDIASQRDYILGPGDDVIIYLWGRAENEYTLTVDREGKIFIPKVGAVVAWGKTVEEFERDARLKLQAIYTEVNMIVSLGRIRAIRIYLTGEVVRPGAYTVSSLTSLFNALYLAGGPTENGSMRSIKLMRSGEAVATVDLYRFLLQGDNSSDVRLQSGDAIFVPVGSLRVAVRGEVHREAVYELAEGETAADLLRLAGGPTPRAHLERVMLERISVEREWEVIDLSLLPDDSSGGREMCMVDGDRMTLYSIFEAKKNMVAVFGRVKFPGYYERSDTTRVSHLIARGQLQPYDVYYERANLFRRFSDMRMQVIPVDLEALQRDDSTADFVLRDRDSLHIYGINEVTWDKYVYIEGEVARPGQYPLYSDMTVDDLVFLAGSFTRQASLLQGELARFDRNGRVSLHYVQLTGDTADRLILLEGDRLYVRRIPEWRLHRTVTLEGEVRFPGEYVLADRGETLWQLLVRAGGFTVRGFPQGAVLERRSIGKTLERLRVSDLLENTIPVVEDSLGNLEHRVFFNYEQESVNRIIIDMEEILSSDGRSGDIALEPGDRIFVPSQPSGITVLGAVGANGTIKFIPGRKVKHYVEWAGDFTPQADKKGTRLVRANGEVVAGGDALGTRVAQGDIIVIPSRIKKESNWLKTFTTALTATTGVLTTVFLIEKL
jgi:protein involved in polysaccharide export with SLBB domain